MNDQQYPNRVTLEAAVTNLGSKTTQEVLDELETHGSNIREFLTSEGFKNFSSEEGPFPRDETCPVSQYLHYWTRKVHGCGSAAIGVIDRKPLGASIYIPSSVSSAIRANDKEVEVQDDLNN